MLSDEAYQSCPVRHQLTIAIASGLLLGAPACSRGPEPTVASSSRLTRAPGGDPQEAATLSIAPAISALLADADSPLTLSGQERAELRSLYEKGGNAPLWIDATGRATGQAHDALTLLHNATEDGLVPADYGTGPLTAWNLDAVTGFEAPEEAARLDVAMTSGMLRYLRDLHIGRVNPGTIGLRLALPDHRHDFGAILRTAIENRRVAETAADLRPQLAQYRLARAALARYRSLASDPALADRLPFTTSVHPGDVYPPIDLLSRRLTALGDLAPDAGRPAVLERYEGPVVGAVMRFQRRHGLKNDGTLGKATAAALSVPIATRVRQLELTLERLRWLPHLGDEPFIALNIPMFRLWAFDANPQDGVPSLGMNVIVGRAIDRRTPVFVETMREVIIRPYWNVPASILRQEVLPRLETDPGYLQRESMEIVRGAGDDAIRVDDSSESRAALRRGALRIRQRPGPKNALGLIKFVFPNEEDVYMHGTPAQALFARSRRDFSHGCVRVEDPVRLAEWVLRDNPGWSRDGIVAAMEGTETLRVPLRRPIRVILFYTTAAVMPEEGEVWFADDIYRHDARLDRALTSGRPAN